MPRQLDLFESNASVFVFPPSRRRDLICRAVDQLDRIPTAPKRDEYWTSLIDVLEDEYSKLGQGTEAIHRMLKEFHAAVEAEQCRRYVVGYRADTGGAR